MEKIRSYGDPPYRVFVIHGGPGVPGTMAPLAQKLGKRVGVLEPFQSKDTIAGLIVELKGFIMEYGEWPIILIGHSFGAWLSYLLASVYPTLVKKLILIGSGAFEEKYVPLMEKKRAKRLTNEEKKRITQLMATWDTCDGAKKKALFKEFGTILTRVESYQPLSHQLEGEDYQPHLFKKLMEELKVLRKSGQLLACGQKIRTPVLAIHGDWDCHPFQGVQEPLSQVLQDFRFILLLECGHTPWNEEKAQADFYEIIYRELDS